MKKSNLLVLILATAVASSASAANLDHLIPASRAQLNNETSQRIAADSQIQGQLNDVQNAAQIANEKGDAGAVRMDGIESSLANTDGRSINNAVRLDDVEQKNAAQDTRLDKTNQRVDAVAYTTNSNTTRLGKVEEVNKAQDTRLDKTNQRVDAVAWTANSNTGRIGKVEEVNKQQDVRLDKTNQRVDAVAWTTNSNTNRIGKVEGRTTTLEARADETDLTLGQHASQLGNHQERLNGHDQRFASQDEINEALGTKVAGLYQDTSYLKSEVRQARREAKEAKSFGAIALAVAGHQFNTEPSAGFQAALSASTIGGYQGVALGMGGAINQNWFVNAAVATSRSETGGVISGTYTFGR